VFTKEAEVNVTHKSDQEFETCEILSMVILPRMGVLPHPPLLWKWLVCNKSIRTIFAE